MAPLQTWYAAPCLLGVPPLGKYDDTYLSGLEWLQRDYLGQATFALKEFVHIYLCQEHGYVRYPL
jgi:hypothetical protein